MKINSSVQTRKRINHNMIFHKLSQNNNPISNYYFNTSKNRQIIAQYNNNLKKRKHMIKNNSALINISNSKNNLDGKNAKKNEEEVLPKINPYSFRYFYYESNNKNMHKSLPCSNTIEKEKNNFESNFMRIKKDSNIYTANVDFIKNKKLVIIDKFRYDNNIYKPDRLGIYDMQDIPHSKKEKGKGLFGKIYFNHNKYNLYNKLKENLNKNASVEFLGL